MIEPPRTGKNSVSTMLQPYAIASLAVGLVFALTWFLWSSLEPFRFMLLLAAIVFGVWYGGLGPGIWATVLSALVGAAGDVASFRGHAVFVGSALFITLLTAATRRRVGNKIAANDQRLRLLLENIKDTAVFMVNCDGAIMSWDVEAARLYGYNAAEVTGQATSLLYTPEDKEKKKPQQDLQTAAAEGRVENQGWQRRKNNSQFWANLMVTRLQDDSGQLRGFTYVTRDFTHRRQAQEERGRMLARMRATQAEVDEGQETVGRLQRLTDPALTKLALDDLLTELLDRISKTLTLVTAAIFVIHSSRQTLAIRAACGLEEQESGRETDVPLNRGFASRVVNERRPVWTEDLRQAEGYSPLLQEHGVKSLLGVPLMVEQQVIGILSVGIRQRRRFNEQETRLVQIVADRAALAIDRSRLAETAESARFELESRVAERTAKLQEANMELEGFAYTVSHDLRAPLRAMQGFAQALLEDYAEQMDNIAQDYAQRIISAATRMDTMIQDLLTYSRFSRAELELRPVSLSAVVTEALTELEAELKDRRAQVTVEDPLLEASGHHSTLVHIVMNLLTNALKFVAPGVPPHVRVWSETRDWWVRLWVEDNGIGIEPEHQQRIFRVFERLHGADTYTGTGIGLAIVRKGAERMSGQVGVESTFGQGSRFWVELQQQRSSR